jgi:hypothetical protein
MPYPILGVLRTAWRRLDAWTLDTMNAPAHHRARR